MFTAYAGAADKVTTYVDLQPQANQVLTANFGSGREGNNLSSFPKGEQTFNGLKFKVEDRFIQLGSALLKEEKPRAVKWIQVDRAFARLYILHSTFYGEGMTSVPDDTEIARYRVNYEDGTSESVPIVYGQDVRDWWFPEGGKEVTRGKVAWEGDNELAKQFGYRLRIYTGTWENPNPKKKVIGIDYEKVANDDVDSPASPFCLALTVEEE
jgi:hypothetical protein